MLAGIGHVEQIHCLRFAVAGAGSIGLRQALEPQRFELYAPGFHHLALAVESRADVDAAHAAALAAVPPALLRHVLPGSGRLSARGRRVPGRPARLTT